MTSTSTRHIAARALSRELANVSDNLYRYRMQQRAEPQWITGNGQPIGEVIVELERQRDELHRALEEING